MPLQNRVTPWGEIVTDPARGSMMGNRGGALHDGARALSARRWVSQRWICCRLSFAGRRRTVMAPRRYTELFFLDEATALAAGHRPCFECRRTDAMEFARLWSAARGLVAPAGAREIDQVLHAERVDPLTGAKRLNDGELDLMPTGAIVLAGPHRGPHLVLAESLRPWSISGYGAPLPRPRRCVVTALTPPGTIGALKFGYVPMMHETSFERS